MVYKTLAATTAGVFIVLLTDAVLQNRESTTLQGSIGEGTWETSYTDIALVVIFGALFAITRWHKHGRHFVHVMCGAAFGTAIALIISKWVIQWRWGAGVSPPTVDPEETQAFNAFNRSNYNNYAIQNYRPVKGGCGCGH